MIVPHVVAVWPGSAVTVLTQRVLMSKIKQVSSKSNSNPRTLRDIEETLAPLEQLISNSVNLVRKPLPAFRRSDRDYYIPRYLFIGPKGGIDPIRVALFAGIYGDQPEGTFALIDFVRALEQAPETARDYCLFLYPIANPTGFESRTRRTSDGIHLPEELWKNSLSPEVQHLQSELWMHAHDGIVSFKTDADADELTVAIAGPIFARHFLRSALDTAQDFLPQVTRSNHNALPKWKSVLLDSPNDIIRAAPGQKPAPFEIVITVPGQAPTFLQKAAVVLLLKAVLVEYRRFIAFVANI